MSKRFASIVVGVALLGLSACSSDPDRSGVTGSLKPEAVERIRTEGTDQLKRLGLVVTGTPQVRSDKDSVYAVDGNGCSLVIYRSRVGRLGVDVPLKENDEQYGSYENEFGERRGTFWVSSQEQVKQLDAAKSCKFHDPAATTPTN